jgi:hypothetical protein
MIFLYTYTMYFYHIDLLNYSFFAPFPPPFVFTNFNVFQSSVFMYVCWALWSYSPLYHPCILPSTSLLCAWKQSFLISKSYFCFVWLFRSRFHTWEKTWYLSFWVRLTSLNMMISSATCKWCNFILLYGWMIIYVLCMPHFLHPSVHGHIGWCHNLAFVNRGQVSLLYAGLHSFRWTPRSGVAG